MLLTLLAVPAAGAFSTDVHDLSITYDADAPPIIVAAGELGFGGSLTGGLLVGGSTTTALAHIPHLTIVEKGEVSAIPTLVEGATVEISSGALLARWDTGALTVGAGAPYGIGLALPQAPFPTKDNAPQAGFLLAGEALGGDVSWSGGEIELTPLDATLTVRDARGQPLPDWNARHVNAQSHDARDPEATSVVLRANGAFAGRLGATIVAGGAGAAADLALDVSPAADDRFAETVALLDSTSQEFSEQPQSFAGQQGPLALLDQMSGLLNGALILIPGDGTTTDPSPLESRWGAEPFAVGQFNIVRGDDLSVAWKEGDLRVSGEPTVALGREGFAVDAPITVWIFPIASLVLWILALGAIVWSFVKRPPAAKTVWSVRLGAAALWVLVLLLSLALWDRSFATTFGTSALTVAKAEGVSPATLPHIGVLAGLELAPWGIASLLFALPVRIAAGIALRHLGKGKSYKGLASAAGLVSLAIFGPIYALYCFNLIWARAASAMPG